MKRLVVATAVVLLAFPFVGCNPTGETTSSVPGGDTPAVAGGDVALPPATEPFPGYTLFTPLRSAQTYLVNLDGQVVHTWEAQYSPGSMVYLLENGDILRGARIPDHDHFRGGGIGGRIQRFDWDGHLTWDFVYANDEHCLHHDIEPLPNGNILMIAWEARSKEEAIAAGRDPELVGDELWPDHIIEVKPEGLNGGEIVWQWNLWDHLIQDFDETKENYGIVAEHPELVDINYLGETPPPSPEELRRLRSLGYTGGSDEPEDSQQRRRPGSDWIHSNAIHYNPELDQISLSALRFNELWVIDHSTTTEEAAGHAGGRSGKGGDLLYRWGNPAAYNSGTVAAQRLFAQHDVRWIEAGRPGAGHFMVFNNGRGRLLGGDHTTIDEIAAPLDADGNYVLNDYGTYDPDEALWSYAYEPKEEFFAGHISGARRLPNGNTLICNGETGEFWEVNSEGTTVWKFTQPFGGELDRNGRPSPPPRRAEGGQEGRRGGGPRQETTAVFRATRYPLDYPAFASRTLEPLDPQPTPFLEQQLAEQPAEEEEATPEGANEDEVTSDDPAGADNES